MKRRFLPLMAVALLATGAFAQDTVKIQWKPKQGAITKSKIEMVAKMDVGTGPTDVEFSAVSTSTVTKVAEDGKVTIDSTQGEIKMLFGGQDMSSMMGDTQIATTVVFSPLGEVLETKSSAGPEMSQPKLENAFVVLYPKKDIAIGESWKRTKAGDANLGTVDSETTYTYLGTEKVGDWDCYKIKVSYKETVGATPMTMTGTIWLDVADGEACKSALELKNVEFQAGLPPADATMKLTRLK